MTEEKKVKEIIFHPGCFDNFEGTQEELDQIVDSIKKLFVSGELMHDSRQLTEEELEDALRNLDEIDNNTRQ